MRVGLAGESLEEAFDLGDGDALRVVAVDLLEDPLNGLVDDRDAVQVLHRLAELVESEAVLRYLGRSHIALEPLVDSSVAGLEALFKHERLTIEF